jgi:hypothetical protein
MAEHKRFLLRRTSIRMLHKCSWKPAFSDMPFILPELPPSVR